MGQVEDEELRALRRRAYGRDADIHLDPRAVERLRELESEARPPLSRDTRDVVASNEDDDGGTPEPPDESADPPPEQPNPARVWLTRIAGLRRSTIVVGLAVIVAAATLATALTLIQRVQVDPLQRGAKQIARLEPTDGYPVPKIFGGTGVDSINGSVSYQPFYGLHVVVTRADGLFVKGPDSTCLTVYPATAISDPLSQSASGPLMGGCSAGRFPAMTQFPMSTDGLPASLRAKFDRNVSFQFVYDPVHHEVVVFSDR